MAATQWFLAAHRRFREFCVAALALTVAPCALVPQGGGVAVVAMYLGFLHLGDHVGDTYF